MAPTKHVSHFDHIILLYERKIDEQILWNRPFILKTFSIGFYQVYWKPDFRTDLSQGLFTQGIQSISTSDYFKPSAYIIF